MIYVKIRAAWYGPIIVVARRLRGSPAFASSSCLELAVLLKGCSREEV
jgi:hypothetical protein